MRPEKGGTGGRGVLTAIGVVLTATAITAVGGRARAVPTPDTQPSSSAPPDVSSTPAPSAAADAPAPPTDPAAPTEPEMRSTSDRAVAYTLSAELFPETHTVRGSGSISWRNTARVATDRLYVHLYLNAFKNERTAFWRVPVSGFRGDPLNSPGRIEVDRFFVREFDRDLWQKDAHTPGDPDDATDIEIVLPRPVEPGESLTVDMSWTSHLPTVTIRTGYLGSFHMVAQWFPKLARLEPDGTWAHFPFHRMSEFYADYGTYDVTVSAPSSFVVGAVGSLASQITAPPSQVAPAPTAAPSATESASAPPETPKSTQEAPLNTVRRFTATDVHDFAFSAWDKFQTLEDKTANGVKIICLYPPGYDEAARIEIDAVKFGLGYMGAAFGVYPYNTLTIVHPPNGAEEAGGMEYPTLITTGGSWRTSGIIQTRERVILTLHELAHQWFYGLVGSNEHRFPFLDEGLTSYAEMEACEAKWPDASAAELFGLRVGMPAIYRAGALESAQNARVSDGAAICGRSRLRLPCVLTFRRHHAYSRQRFRSRSRAPRCWKIRPSLPIFTPHRR
ncbi:MAG: M1 family metallopeptidase [Polyangiaceae bacterium]|nr:M1 family metallopeptidase [Polyangiaceae bacterium]